MTNIANLRQSEQNVLTLLEVPTTYDELATTLNISESTARDHVAAIRRAGIPIGEKRDEAGRKRFFRSVKTRDALDERRPTAKTTKAAHTKAKKDVLLDMKDWLEDDLTGRAPVVAEGGLTVEESHEDMVVHRSDDHVGAYYEDEYGTVIYDENIAPDRIRTINDRTFDLKARQEAAGVSFDTLHILLGGDGVHGEGIHEDQPWESALTLVEQIELYADLYMEFIDRATREFESVQVVCQNGNHGELRGDGMSPDANADDVAFMILEKRCMDRGYSNVTFRHSEGTYFTNFPIRGNYMSVEDAERDGADESMVASHRGHLRHGQNSLFHIGTSSGRDRWRGWLQRHQFDIAYRGHFHEFRVEHIDSRPVIMSGSICPPSDYEESFGAWSEPAATVHGVADHRPLTWMYPLDFQ